MQYEFEGCDNPKCPDKKRGRKFVDVKNIYVIPYSMKDAPGLGAQIPCPCCGTGKITRIISSGIQGLVKGSLLPNFTHGQSYMADLDGRQTKLTFVDHPHTDPRYESGLVAAAKRAGVSGIGKGYYNEKFGKLCVDVASDVKDPLGKINRDTERVTTKTAVNTPVKRKPAPPRKRGEPKHQYGPIPMRNFR